MRRETGEVFHALMKGGWIDRREEPALWAAAEDAGVQEELDVLRATMGVDFVRVRDRLYLVPTQENDLFLKNNVDYRRDIRGDSGVRLRDLYLMNYLAIYLIYLFFSGGGSDPLCREFISREEFLAQFTAHCKGVEQEAPEGGEKEYGENFRQLAAVWLSKVDGESATQKFDCKYGVLNRILVKLRGDGLFQTGEDGLIRPTRKMKDLMPYFLRRERVAEIQRWVREGGGDAENQ